MTNGSVSPNRRTLLKAAGIGAASVASMPLLSACNAQPARRASTTSPALLPAPPGQVEPLLDLQAINNALAKLDEQADTAMERTGLPGMAIAVVYRDEVVYSKGFGVREVGKPEKISPDTVFQLTFCIQALGVHGGGRGSGAQGHQLGRSRDPTQQGLLAQG